MSESCTLVLVRHGETDANVRRLLQGHGNFPLNANGKLQAAAVAERLREETFDAAYSSDLDRAWETACSIVQLHPGLELHKAPELREWNLGELENRTQTELQKLYPAEMAAFRYECKEVHVPGGENLTEFQARVENYLTELADANPGKKLLIVTHGGVLQRIFRMAVGPVAPGNYLSLSGNAGIGIIRRDITARAWQMTAWNSTDHLRKLVMHETLVY